MESQGQEDIVRIYAKEGYSQGTGKITKYLNNWGQCCGSRRAKTTQQK